MECRACRSQNVDTARVCSTCGEIVLTPHGPGTVIGGRYEILGLLGRGGMGTVHKARDLALEETVALKVLRPDLEWSEDMERRFRSEIKLARKVRHHNVCGIHEYGREGSLSFISMELIEGRDLKKILEDKGALPWPDALDLILQACHGLGAIHQAGIIHRDLKPPNIMLDPSGVVRLMDFGIAKLQAGGAASGATRTGHIVGTPEYMSPEQARGEAIDFRSDVYAMGIVIFEIMSGEVPFRGDTPVATILKHLNEPPPLDGPLSARIPRVLLPILGRALAKEAAARFSTMDEFADALVQTRETAPPRAVLVPEVRAHDTHLVPGLAAPQRWSAVTKAESPAEAPRSLPTLGRSRAMRPFLAAAAIAGGLGMVGLLRSGSLPAASSGAVSVSNKGAEAASPGATPEPGAPIGGSAPTRELAPNRAPASPAPSLASAGPLASNGVCLSVTGSASSTQQVSSILDAELRRQRLTRTDDSRRARYLLRVVIEADSSEEDMFEARVVRNRARVNVEVVDLRSAAVLIEESSPMKTNTIQDRAVGQALAARDATTALVEGHPQILRALTPSKENR